MPEEVKTVELTKFIGSMERYGLAQYYDMATLPYELASSPMANDEDSGLAYNGALLCHINLALSLSQRYAQMVSKTFQTDDNMIAKACLIMHLSRRHYYVPNENDWEVRQRGLLYRFSTLMEGVLKTGERSAMEAMNNGIKLTATEFEMIKALDRNDLSNSNENLSIMTTIIRQANEMAFRIEKERHEQRKNRK